MRNEEMPAIGLWLCLTLIGLALVFHAVAWLRKTLARRRVKRFMGVDWGTGDKTAVTVFEKQNGKLFVKEMKNV